LIGLVVNMPFYRLIFVFSLYFQKINGCAPGGRQGVVGESPIR